MAKPVLLCMVGNQGQLVGGLSIGVRRTVHVSTGAYLLFAPFPEKTDSVRLSALPVGWAGQVAAHERGISVKILDRGGRPADHGFCLVVERGTNPREAPAELVTRRAADREPSQASGFAWPAPPVVDGGQTSETPED